MRIALASLLAVLLILCTATFPYLYTPVYAEHPSVSFEIFGEPACPHCRATNATLNTMFPGRVRFYDIGVNATALRIYIELWRAVVKTESFGVPFTVVLVDGRPRAFVVGERPPEWWRSLVDRLRREGVETALLCMSATCTLLGSDEYQKALRALAAGASGVSVALYRGFDRATLLGMFTSVENSTPPPELAGLLNGSRAYAVVCGRNAVLITIDRDVPRRIIVSNQTIEVDRAVLGLAERLAVFPGREGVAVLLRTYIGEDGQPFVKSSLLSGSAGRALLRVCGLLGGEEAPPIATTLAILTGLALSDAVNPCAVFIYTTLLIASILASSGRKRLPLATGAAFIAAVYTGYLAIGLGLMTFLRYVPTWLLGVVAIGFGVWVVATGVAGRSRVVAKESLLDLVSRAATSTLLSFALGLLVTFTLLPCSSGPYVVFAGIASRYSTPMAVGLLALYNAVFVTPLVAIMLAVVLGMRHRAVQEFITRHSRGLSVAAGLILIGVGVYVLLGL